MQDVVVDLLDANAEHAREFAGRFDDVQDAQRPGVVSVSCSDSRVLHDHVWGNEEPGQVFTCSNIGNRVFQRVEGEDVVSGDVLYPIAHAGTRVAVVVGHTGCGAVTATHDAVRGIIDPGEPAGVERCIALLEPYLAPGVDALPEGLGRAERINRLVEYNVDRQVNLLVESDDVPADVDVVGVVYDFQDVYGVERGEVHVVNVAGETDPDAIRAAHPEVAGRVARLWTHQ